MTDFKKYSSIENSYNRSFMEKVSLEMPTDLTWVVQEKVHGTNTSFLCDGKTVDFAKRTSVLGKDENFYDFPELLNRYQGKVMSMFNGLKKTYPTITSISVFGEMFGGGYPHPDVAKANNVSLIQKGVYYSPIHEFYGFDIYLFDGDDSRYLGVDEANDLFEKYGFFYARRLFQGSLKECLEYPNAFNTNIPEWLGLPVIEDNICEGVVIRPIVPMYFRNGSRVLIKNKNEKFAEKKSVKKNPTSTPVEMSDALKALLPVAEQYVNENRLANVVSHIGEVEFPKDFGKVMGALTKDAIEDFLKEHKDAYMALEKGDQKQVNKRMSSMSADVVKKVYMSQAYII